MNLMIQQIRFYGDQNGSNNDSGKSNYPSDVNMLSLKRGSVFEKYTPMLSLGIQSLPGTKFYINNSEYPIILGYSGIYELKLEKAFPIYSLRFDIESLVNIGENPNGYLIVDILYEGE